MDTYVTHIINGTGNEAIRIPACTLILLNPQAQLLLLKNKATAQWGLPLTDIQHHETATQTTQRLAQQQTGVILDDIECVGYSSADDANLIFHQQAPVRLHCFIMVSTAWQGDVTMGVEASDAQFFSIQSLPLLPNHTQQTLQLFKKWLPSREFQFG